MSRIASTSTNADRLTGLPNTYLSPVSVLGLRRSQCRRRRTAMPTSTRHSTDHRRRRLRAAVPRPPSTTRRTRSAANPASVQRNRCKSRRRRSAMPTRTRRRIGRRRGRMPRVAVSPPASFPPRLTTTQLPSACGWCHQPPEDFQPLGVVGHVGRTRVGPAPCGAGPPQNRTCPPKDWVESLGVSIKESETRHPMTGARSCQGIGKSKSILLGIAHPWLLPPFPYQVSITVPCQKLSPRTSKYRPLDTL